MEKSNLEVTDLFVRVVKAHHKHNISHLQLQLIAVSGVVVVYRFYLERNQARSQNKGLDHKWTLLYRPNSY